MDLFSEGVTHELSSALPPGAANTLGDEYPAKNRLSKPIKIRWDRLAFEARTSTGSAWEFLAALRNLLSWRLLLG